MARCALPIDMWGPRRERENAPEGQLRHVKATIISVLRAEVVLDILQNFTKLGFRSLSFSPPFLLCQGNSLSSFCRQPAFTPPAPANAITDSF
jgi:hypothetical protein